MNFCFIDVPKNQAVLPVVIQHAVAAEHHAPSATVRNAIETWQLATGEDSAAHEEHSSADNHQAEEEEDPDAEDNEQLQFDAKTSDITGFDSQHDDGVDEHCQKWLRYITEKEELMGASVVKGQGINSITWTVWLDILEAEIPLNINNKYKNVGVKRFDFQNATTISYSGTSEHMNLLLLLIHLWPEDWWAQISHINSIIDKRNDENVAKIQRSSLESQTWLHSQMRHITKKEFWIFLVFSLLLKFMGDLAVSGILLSQRDNKKRCTMWNGWSNIGFSRYAMSSPTYGLLQKRSKMTIGGWSVTALLSSTRTGRSKSMQASWR